MVVSRQVQLEVEGTREKKPRQQQAAVQVEAVRGDELSPESQRQKGTHSESHHIAVISQV